MDNAKELEVQEQLRKADIAITYEEKVSETEWRMGGAQERNGDEVHYVDVKGDSRLNAMKALQVKFKSV